MKASVLALACLTVASGHTGAQLRSRPDTATGRVLRVDDGAAPLSHVDFLDLRTAVDAARDGDLILVSPGEYRSVSVSGKSLAIVADGEGVVTIAGVSVADLHERQNVLVRGIRSTGNVTIERAQGAVWLENIELPKLVVRDSRVCAVSRSTLWKGVDARNTWGLFLYDSSLRGWNGGEAYTCACGLLYDCNLIEAGNGTSAVLLQEVTALLWGCDVRAGNGGDGSFSAWYCCAVGGDGGSALVARSGALVTLVDTVLVPGLGGYTPCFGASDGADGLPILLDGGEVHELEGPARRYRASAASRLQGTVTLSFEAWPDDRPIVFLDTAPLAKVAAASGLPSLVAMDSLQLAFDPLETGNEQFAVPPFPIGGAEFDVFFSQAFYEVPEEGALELVPGPPSAAVVLREPCFGIPPVPDCNANELADGCEVVEGLSSDADLDGLPDECTTAYHVTAGPLPAATHVPVDFVFPPGPRPSGPVRVRIAVQGLSTYSSNYTFDVALNGFKLTELFAESQASCEFADAKTLKLEAGIYAAIVRSDDVVVTVTPPYLRACPDAAVSVELAYPAAPIDCNGNFVPDAFEVTGRNDCDGNGVLDVCELRRTAGASIAPLDIYSPLDVIIPPPAQSASDVTVLLDLAASSGGTIRVNGVIVASYGAETCPLRTKRALVVARDRWNAIVGDGSVRVRAQPASMSSTWCDDSGVMEVQWTDPALDCNGNGRLDECDIAAGSSADVNENGIPDECE